MLGFSVSEVDAESLPWALLLEADPSERNVRKYLTGARCFSVKKSNDIVGVCVLNTIGDGVLELFNIAVSPDVQGQGVGSALLRQVIDQCRSEGVRRIELGTGTFGYQLAFYQRQGFRVEGVVRDFFLDHYDEPVMEMGIQHKDMLRLGLDLH
ncbi:N-acetyltransferase GCN5 [Alcanivorax xiamenensis]|uniref:N-acetyltransferase GCN5 n=1 Tax=Alcanivorax xiamenensis TaxID=1177156 RepID=A0ABQ6YBY8_9GAMM|nr:GNAT family N-acetyltransferase [Alcanivorax xiamenensis]KAF0807638.1 N-acetyltransferase GCN5 [Alcanivorax xiamenensis]